MWGQISIICFGVWLLLSPLIFHGQLYASKFLVEDMMIGTVLVSLGLFNCFYKNRYFSVLIALVGIWCWFSGYFFYEHPRPAGAQNYIVIGLLVLMFVVIPPDDKVPKEA